jgi:hypothetical protein
MVPYWWAPEWIRGTAADSIYDKPVVPVSSKIPVAMPMADGRFVIPTPSYGRIHAVKEKGDVNLYMKAKDGNLSFIQGSIQKEFKRWHEDRSIDYLLLGMDPDEIIAQED